MKKLFLLFCIFYNTLLLSQTLLNSYPLHLNRPLENSQLLNIQDEKTKDVYVFAADDKYVTILKYNPSLFLTNRYIDSIKNVDKRIIMGHSISEDGNPILYWATENLKNLRIVKYYLDLKNTRTLNFDFPVNNEYIITTFQKNNTFYVLSKETNQQHLLLYEFNNGKCEIKMFDLSEIIFQNDTGQNMAFNTVLRYYPMEKMDTEQLNAIDKAANKSKIYVLDQEILLTFDYSSKKTQVVSLNMETLAVTGKNILQPVSKKASKTSNSFFYENKLLQIKANNDEFLFDVKDLKSGTTLKSMAIDKKDTIPFKNSPLFIQINDKKPQQIKKTSSFLKQLSNLNSGISAFKNRNTIFISFGGFTEYEVSGYNYRSNALFADIGYDFGSYSQYITKMVYFDALFTSNFEFINGQALGPPAIDNLYYYMSTSRNVTLHSILNRKDYYILGYYDDRLKQYIMRKFTDGYINEDSGNPIMNKAQFSKAVDFAPIKFIEN